MCLCLRFTSISLEAYQCQLNQLSNYWYSLCPTDHPAILTLQVSEEYLRQTYQTDITIFKYRVANPQNEVVISTHNYNIRMQRRQFVYFTSHVTLWLETNFKFSYGIENIKNTYTAVHRWKAQVQASMLLKTVSKSVIYFSTYG